MTTQGQTTCHVPNCGKPLYASKSGRKTLLCETHEHEYRKGTLRLRTLRGAPAKPASQRKTVKGSTHPSRRKTA